MVNAVGNFLKYRSAFGGPFLRGFLGPALRPAGRPFLPPPRGLPGPPVPNRSARKLRSSAMSVSNRFLVALISALRLCSALLAAARALATKPNTFATTLFRLLAIFHSPLCLPLV